MTKPNSRIYTVMDSEDGTTRLIRATHPSVAIKRAAGERYSASIASQEELVDLLSAGVQVIDATAGEPADSE